jgi:hypothetical protein
MAHFAQLDENNVVINVIKVDNNDILDSNSIENEAIGIEFCKNLLGQDTRWVQTSYNASFRKNYAIIGQIYDETRNAFRMSEGPFTSWILDEDTCRYKAPIDPPEDRNTKAYVWNEETVSWADKTPTSPFPSWIFENGRWTAPVPMPSDGKKYRWDENSLSWLEIVPILDGQPPEII